MSMLLLLGSNGFMPRWKVTSDPCTAPVNRCLAAPGATEVRGGYQVSCAFVLRTRYHGHEFTRTKESHRELPLC